MVARLTGESFCKCLSSLVVPKSADSAVGESSSEEDDDDDGEELLGGEASLKLSKS